MSDEAKLQPVFLFRVISFFAYPTGMSLIRCISPASLSLFKVSFLNFSFAFISKSCVHLSCLLLKKWKLTILFEVRFFLRAKL